MGITYDIGGLGDKGFNDLASRGVDLARSQANISLHESAASAGETDSAKATRLRQLCQSGANPVIATSFTYANALSTVSKECPSTKFAIIDDSSVNSDNVASLIFAEEQGSFLVGVAAALKTATNRVGFIGGCQIDIIGKLQAGFVAGVHAVRSSITVDVNYLSTLSDACDGFKNPSKGTLVANSMYDAGADIIFQVSGGSGTGVFQAAKDKGRKAIGVDIDQYNTVDASLQSVVLTSMLKRVDTAVDLFLLDMIAGRFTAGTRTFDAKVDGVGYATSGGYIDDVKSQIEAYRTKIINGSVVVPTHP